MTKPGRDSFSWESASPNIGGQLISTTRRAPGISAERLVTGAQGTERFYWQSANSDIAFAGFGVAADLKAWGAERFHSINRQAKLLFAQAIIEDGGQPLAAPRLFGGFSFRDDFTPDNTWAVYHPAQFILPHYQLVQVGSESWLTLNALLPAEDDIDEILPQLRGALQNRIDLLGETSPERSPRPKLKQLNYPMSAATWNNLILQATSQMREGELDKVVLSRVCEIRFERQVPVARALQFLNDTYPDCHRFLFEPLPHHAFYGATPELLARVNGHQLETMGLAGSVARGQTEMEAERLGQQLLDSSKDRFEHDLVVQALRRRLEPLTETLSLPDEPQILRLGYIQHLHTPIHGRLRQAAGILPLIEALHPTPALGGTPRDLAIAFIRKAEPVPRGWYAAPIGWIDHNLDGLFSVAIRSAITQDRRVWLHAGAGIVADSQPDKEWEETALKFRPMLLALGINSEL